MHFGTIASGSSGNCLYVGDDNTHILIDAGISGRRIQKGLDSFGVDAGRIDAVLITHEHIDHVAGIGVLARKYKMPIYGTEATLKEMSGMKSVGVIPQELLCPVNPCMRFKIGNIEVEPFRISHDAVDPVSYALTDERRKIGIVTDLGYFDESIVGHLKDSDLLYVEANHDIHMLQVGPYPYYLKQRILGNKGHLCNEMAGRLIKELLGERLKKVILGHLSKENNYPELALETVLLELDSTRASDAYDVCVAPRDCASNLIAV